MIQKPAAFQDTRPMPVQTDDGLRAAREIVMENSTWIGPLQQEMARVIVGQKHLLDRLLVALLTNGHVLLEGVPGLAKTLALKTLAAAVDVRFKRLQFTPDMLPADIVGTMIYNPQDGAFRTKHGPIFSNLILADEINRAPAKVQSALLEAMQEHQVTIGDETYPLPNPFLVLATQNPLEQEGTYPLPEAQIDRFMMKVIVNYPNRTEERAEKIADSLRTPAITTGIIPFNQLHEQSHRADIIITSTGAAASGGSQIFTAPQAKSLLQRRRNRPVFFIDIAMPRDVAPEINQLEGCFVYDIDDLQQVAAQNQAVRSKEAEAAESIVTREVELYGNRLAQAPAIEAIKQLQLNAEALRQSELERTAHRLAAQPLTPEQQAAVDALTKSLTSKLLHSQLAALRSPTSEDE